MDLKKSKIIFSLVIFVMSSSFGIGQIELSKETTVKEEKEKKAKKEKERRDKDSLSGTSIYINTNWSYTPRKLIENEGLFGKPLGERENETPGNKWSFGLGFRNQLHKNVALEGGIAFMRNAEKYSFEGIDTSYSYKTEYSYIAMPIKVYYTYGKSIKLLAGVGITPQMFVRYKQDREWKTSEGKQESETFKTTTGFNSFTISGTVSAGVQFELGKRLGIQLIPEYRIQLTSSNNDKNAYKHYARAIGINAGLIFKL